MDASAHRAVVRADDALRLGLGLVWVAEGLIPKILFAGPAEIAALRAATPYLSFDPAPFVPVMGALEVLLGLLLLLGLAVRPVLWGMLAALAAFTLDLLVLQPGLLADPYGGLAKNAGLLGATAAALALRGAAFRPLLVLVGRLRRDYLNEIGANAIYRQQARGARGLGIGEVLREFARTEREHAAGVRDALRRIGARGSFLGGPVALAATVLGWISARLPDRAMLAFDRALERMAVRSYAASAAQFAAWGEDTLAASFRLMAAAEEEHARRMGTLMRSPALPAGTLP